ncbi:MAG: hypothetical protein K2M69_00390 [Muribaculaceae bacterium]|nr:hypothetical protein [Muribaculaceae bacterium]
MKKIWIMILGIISLMASSAFADQWKLHPTYSNFLNRIIDTPKYTYILSGNQPLLTYAEDYTNPTNSLFRYDKGERETQWLNISNKLSAPVLTAAEYNFDKGYLLAAYDDGDMDLIYDDGFFANIPGLKLADDYLKRINTITFVPSSDLAYVATDFGYLTVNDRKHEIGTSRNLDREVTAAVAFDGKIFIGTPDGLFYTTERGGSNLEKIEGPTDIHRFIIVGNRLYIYYGSGWDSSVDYISEGSAELTPQKYIGGYLLQVEPQKNGFFIDGATGIWKTTGTADPQFFTKPSSIEWKKTAGSDANRIFVDFGLEGVKSFSVSANEWKQNGETILPDAANCYKSTGMAYSDKYGMLVRNHGIDYNFSSIVPNPPDLISGLQNGSWRPYSIAAVAPEKSEIFHVYNPNGLAIDPRDKDVVYCGSVLDGILRLNLADPAKSLRIGRKDDDAAGKQGYIGLTESPTIAGIEKYTPFSAPAFDADGNMWVTYNNLIDSRLEVWCWTPEDRLATTSASNYRPMKCLSLDDIPASTISNILPLTGTPGRNMLVLTGRTQYMAVIDHGGTLDNRADDKIYAFGTNVYDQDGNKVELGYYKTLFEDPSTGYVWVGTDEGLFYFNPKNIWESADPRVTKVKVARNDGTSLADFLLEGANINRIATDAQGRKWFATSGGGITCTSSSGAEVLKVYTSDNSLLPSDYVYGLCYNPANNSMMVSTDSGLAELYLSGVSVDSDDNAATVYPNPVRPDYYGYVNIEGLEDGALVKITDSAGNLIKELGFADGGTARWDVTNLNNKRVRSGVYYVLASGVDEGSGFSAAAKILVVN